MSRDVGRLLSHVLRHAPERIGIVLDPAGWTSVDDLIRAARKAGFAVDRDILRSVVETNDKKRFTLSADGDRIRAAQGHSVPVDLGLEPSAPPEVLYHGTARHRLDSIFERGLVPGSRRQVHLSTDPDTAEKVGSRHGSPVVLVVAAAAMHASGTPFWRADNGVWLVDHVEPGHLSFAPRTSHAH